MHGPNYWSHKYKDLIVVKLDLTKEDGITTEERHIFINKIKEAFPGFEPPKNKESISLALVVKHIAEQLLVLAGMRCKYAEVKDTPHKGIYLIILSYEIERVAVYTIEAAIYTAKAILDNSGYSIQSEVKDLVYLKNKYELGPTTSFILDEAKNRQIPFKRFETSSLITLGYGEKQKKMRTAIVDSTSGLGMELAGDKEETKLMLADVGLPVPRGFLVYSEDELKKKVGRIKFPIVIKPLDGNHGRGVSTNIKTLEEAVVAFQMAKKISETVIVEEYVVGDDYRFLLVNFKLIAIAMRTPAMVIGDGVSSIEKLINKVNEDPDRGDDSEHVLAPIKVDEITNKILAKQQLTLQSVLPHGQKLILKDTANISTGGTSTDVTDIVHPANIFLAERVARLFNLDICGIDILASDITVPLTRDTGTIIEVNAGPGVRMHTNPTIGLARNVAKPIIDMLFPTRESAYIPLIAVAGTNSHFTTFLMAHLAKHAGYKVGFNSSNGLYLQDHLIFKGDCTDTASAKAVLFDPTINFAVIQCKAEELVKTGLGFHYCNTSIITGISNGQGEGKKTFTTEELVRVKRVVANCTYADGYAILNADDELAYRLGEELSCKIALFSTDTKNKNLQQHCKKGGIAAVLEDDFLTIYNGQWKTRVEKVSALSTYFNGRSEYIVKNSLPAILAAYLQNFSLEDIRSALQTFMPPQLNITLEEVSIH